MKHLNMFQNLGGNGGASAVSNGGIGIGKNGNNGIVSAIKRGLGGGGSGGAHNGSYTTVKSGVGGSATSYSGGAGSGGVHSSDSYEHSSVLGVAGGNAYNHHNGNPQGGVGLPGGSGDIGAASGTGGLLIIYSNKIEGTGGYVAEGVTNLSTSSIYFVGGGGSGGGSVNLFCKELSQNITANNFSVAGGNVGKGESYQWASGGRGGSGSYEVSLISNNEAYQLLAGH